MAGDRVIIAHTKVQKNAVFMLHREMEYPKSVWSLSCAESREPLLTEDCGCIPPPEVAKVAWDLSPHTFAFLAFRVRVGWRKCVLAETCIFSVAGDTLGSEHQSAADSCPTPAWVQAGSSHGCPHRFLSALSDLWCPTTQGYHSWKTGGVVLQCFGMRLCYC